jgi:O-methyltransferase
LVVSGGVVIIDDYGAWQGARRAVDEFLVDKPQIYLHRIDVTGRMFIKQ